MSVKCDILLVQCVCSEGAVDGSVLSVGESPWLDQTVQPYHDCYDCFGTY